MINEKKAKRYCKEDISKIENYDKAIADDTQTWDCHHRYEVEVLTSGMTVLRSGKELIENGRYYGCPANELIFLTKSEHNKLHHKGIVYSECSRRKMSESHKGITPGNKGITTSAFGKAFYDRYGITRCDNIKLYTKEYVFYKRHGKFSWEVK